MAYTWKHFDWYSLNRRNPLTWHFDMPLWPFLRSIQPPQPPKMGGPEAIHLVVAASHLGKRLATS